MIKNVYANGCSMVWGKDLVPMTMAEENAVPHNTEILANDHVYATGWQSLMQYSWPVLFTKYFPDAWVVNVWNAARSGASMARILRTTMQDLCYRNPKDTFVLIGLTEPQRFEVWNADRRDYDQIVLPRGSFKSLPRALRKHAEDVAWYQHQHEATMLTYMTQVLSLQCYLKARGFKYLMVNSLDEYVEQSTASASNLYQQLDHDLIMQDSMYDFCQENRFPFGSTAHPLHQGHAAWARKVYDHATTIYSELAQAS